MISSYLQNTPIKRKLMLIIISVSIAALLLGYLLFVFFDYRSVESRIENDLEVMSSFVASLSSAFLEFDDPVGAEHTLSALDSDPHVRYSALYNMDGRLLAYHASPKADAEIRPTWRKWGLYHEGGFLHSFTQVFPEELEEKSPQSSSRPEPVGTLYIQRDLEELNSRIFLYAIAFCLVLLVATPLAYGLSSRLQRYISEPILHLVDIERQVEATNDYSIRAEKRGQDEVGVLIDGFNAMLDQIQGREKQLGLAKAKAEEANQAKSIFLANMSHELRTPLTAIIGYAEMLIEDAKDRSHQQYIPDLRRVHKAGKHLHLLIDGILDVAKIEAGKLEWHFEIFDIGEAVEEIGSTVKSLLQEQDNTLEVVGTLGIGSMQADKTRVRQILFNLLDNAAKFTRHGAIRLAVAAESVNGQECIRFDVSDTGIGIKEEDAEKLFKPFSQADPSSTRKYGGSGLGLYISRLLSRSMGGDVTFESQFGKGSTFTVRLPRRVSEETLMRTDRTDLLPRKTAADNLALVIEDEKEVSGLIKRLLTKEGFEVRTAPDGKTGLELAGELHPSLITLDVLMPSMDGWEVLSKLKSQPELADIPVILMTIVQNRNLGYALGASDYLTKPLDLDQLRSAVRKYRAGSRASVLVVEDDTEMRRLMRSVLEKEGWSVDEAENGQAALDRLSDSPPDLLLVDLIMPGLDGIKFVSELRKSERWRSIPVIVLTAKDLTAEDQRRLKGKVESILKKEAFSRKELVALIRELIQSRRAPDSGAHG